MELDLHSVSEQNPLMFTSADDFMNAVLQVIKKGVGLVAVPVYSTISQDEVPTKIVKRMLKEKGYGVKNHECFKTVVAHLTPVTKGKTNWYRTTDIQAIPNKI